ncbi:MAG: DUF1616 domain-containing protein [Dehalococcoidia bacterium]|nr:MAG: DUF1616 domain-containing protein [Dehalococcoidia bacterium]
MRLKYNLDLALAALLSLLLIPAVMFTDSLAARVTLGVPFMLFIPGYALVTAFFPDGTRLSAAERIAYSIALSIALVMLDGLLLSYVWRIDVYPLLISLESLTLAVLAIAWRRRRDLPEGERMNLNRMEPRRATPMIDKFLVGVLVLAIVAAGAIVVNAGINNTQPYSEFYLLGAAGKAADYSQNMAVGQRGQLTLVLTNHEKLDVAYTIRIVQEDGHAFIDGNEQNETSFILTNGQKQSYTITFSFDAAGAGQKLEFDLYKGNDTEIYLRTYLRVDVS